MRFLAFWVAVIVTVSADIACASDSDRDFGVGASLSRLFGLNTSLSSSADDIRRTKLHVIAPRNRIQARRQVTQPLNFCVRTCDGRFFSISRRYSKASAEAACQNLCPASETKLYRGREIKDSRAVTGASYLKLANAFRFRRELVNACTCQAHVSGLAQIIPSKDETMRVGDIVAGPEGFMVATSSGETGEAHFERLPQASLKKYGLGNTATR